jgi:DNA-binding CsgD family transcriptional regulator
MTPGGDLHMLTKTLTSREEQIARWVATGLRNKEIATTFFISEQTVKNHLWSIFQKTGTKDRLEVALWMVSRVQGVGDEILLKTSCVARPRIGFRNEPVSGIYVS